MKKKLLSTLLALCMALALLPTSFAAGAVSGSCGDNVTWSYSDSVLTIQGTGAINAYNYGYFDEYGVLIVVQSPWVELIDDIQAIKIGNGVTAIGSEAFKDCFMATSVTIPVSITAIDRGAFRWCDALKDVYYNGSESQWKQIFIDSSDDDNAPLFNATMHYGSTDSGTTPTGTAELKSDRFTYILSNAPVATTECIITEYEFDDDGYEIIGEHEVSHTIYLVPEGTVITNANSKYSITVSVVDPEFGPMGLMATEPSFTVTYKPHEDSEDTGVPYIYAVMSFEETEGGGGIDEGIWVSVASDTTPAEPTTPAGGTAYPSTQTVDLDGKQVTFQMYALLDAKGNQTNYIKIRDLALALNGTKAQFNIGWANGAANIETGKAYISNGSENKTPFSGARAYTVNTSPTNMNGAAINLEGILLKDDNGGGFTYCQVKDLGIKLNFNVAWSAERGIYIETDKPYSGK